MSWTWPFNKKPVAEIEVRKDVKNLPDFLWLCRLNDVLSASEKADDTVCYMKLATHLSETAKRVAQARSVKPLRWEITTSTHKTYTAKTASKYIQIFATAPNTYFLQISTHRTLDPVSTPMPNQYIYRSETIKNAEIANVLIYAEKLHQNEILEELREVE